MDLQTLLALAGFAFATTWTPGPNNVMLAASGASFGWRSTLPHAMGVALGFPVMVFLIALGLGEVFQRSPALRTGLAWLGFAVMLWLAWRIATADAAKARTRSRPLKLHEAAAFQWVNPKAWAMAIGVSATYTQGGDPLGEAVLIAAVFVAAGLTSSQTWVASGAAIGRLLGTGARLRVFNVTMGLLLVLCALWLVLGQ
jgi:threonine/homoserine/homoserine lactone efflux protein